MKSLYKIVLVGLLLISNLISAQADLSIQTSISENNPYPFEPVTINITVTNNGPLDATNVEANALLSSGYAYLSNTPTKGTYNDSTGKWIIGTLANGATETLTISVLADLTDDHLFSATIAALEEDSNIANNQSANSITIQPLANLVASLKVFDPNQSTSENEDLTPNIGHTVTFGVFIENVGPSTASNIETTITIPDGLTYVSHSYENGETGNYDSSTKKWTISSMDLFDRSPILHIETKVNPTGDYTFEVNSNLDEPDPDMANNRERITLNPKDDLSVNDYIFSKKVKTSFSPNPASDYITIESSEEYTSYTIYTLNGLKITKSKLEDNQIDVSNLNKGIYLISFLKDSQIISTEKLVIE